MWAVVLGDFLILLGEESTIHQYYWRHVYKFGGFFPFV